MTRENSTEPASFRYLPLVAATCVVLVGAAVLASWFQYPIGAELGWLRAMHANAAAGFVLAGAALLLAWLPFEHAVLRSVRLLVALAIMALALVTIVEHVLDVDLGIDRLLIDGRALEPQSAAPERMTAFAALGFVLCAAAFMFENVVAPRGRGVSRISATLMGVIGFLTLTAHLYGVPLLYLPFGGTAMAAHTAATFVVLAIGILALHPEHGLAGLVTERTVLGAHLRWLLPAAILVPLLIGGVAVQIYVTFGIARLAIAICAAGTTLSIALVIWLTARLLRGMENRLEIVNGALTGTGQGVLIADRRVTGVPIVYINDAFSAITGYSAKEAVSRPCDFFAARIPADAKELEKLAVCLRDGAHCTAILQARRKNGSVFSCRLSVSGVQGNGGKRAHLIAVLEDVTAEQLAAKAHLELLAEASQARKEAEAANRARDIFLASITHDLRSPLNACLMWTDVLALSPLSEKAAKAIDAIKRNLRLQARLVSDLIDTAKISSGGIDIHPERLDVATLVEGNLDTWSLMAERGRIDFTHQLAPGNYELLIDPERTVQVLNNLLENAFGSTAEHGRVALKLADEGDSVVITVEDDGAGLNETELGMLFTPFWRGSGSARKRTGLGLGLAIADHLVKRHAGTLNATSRGHGQGSTFTVRLPRPSAPRRGSDLRESVATS